MNEIINDYIVIPGSILRSKVLSMMQIQQLLIAKNLMKDNL